MVKIEKCLEPQGKFRLGRVLTHTISSPLWHQESSSLKKFQMEPKDTV